MPDEETIQNQPPEPISSPTSPQPSTEPVPEITPISEAPVMPPEPPEATGNGVIVESNKEAPPIDDEIPLEPTGLQTNPASNGTSKAILLEPSDTQASPVYNPEQQANGTGGTSEILETPTAQMGRNEPFNPVRNILKKAREMIQTKKRKKLEKMMSLFNTKSKITNDEVEKYLHCSDATATRYLSILEKEGRIKQTGKTGQSVSYSKI